MSTSANQSRRGIEGWPARWCAVLIGVAACHLSRPQTAAAEPVSTDTVAAAVRDLGADTLAARTAAEQTLLRMGPDVLDLLPPVDVIEAPGVREAVRRIRTQLELQAARDSIRPRLVTISSPMSLRAAAAEISRQSGNELLIDRLPADLADRRIDVALSGVPFWDSLEKVSTAAGLAWEMVNEPPAVVLKPRPRDQRPNLAGTSSGSFGVSVESVTARPGVIRVQFQVAAEPRLRPLFLKIADSDFQAAVGDRQLTLFSPDARTELPMPSRAPASFAVLFARPADTPADSSLSVKGRLVAETAAGPTEIRFRELNSAIPVARRRGGVTVTLQRANYLATDSGSRRARIRLSIVYDAGGPAFESHRTWIYHNEVYLQSDDGRRFMVNDGFDTRAEANGGVVVEYRFKDLPDLPSTAWELVYVAPTLLIEAPVEFEFRGLPVPPAS